MLAPAIAPPTTAVVQVDDLRCQAHDLRNQLTVVVGFCDMLLPTLRQSGEVARERAAHMVDRIRAAAEQSTGIVSRMMAPASAVGALDLHAFLVDEVGTLGYRLLKENINVFIERGVRVPPVRVDFLGLQRAVVNLATNARDAIVSQSGRTDSGLIRFATSLPPVVAARPYAVLTISDNGPGMQPATLERIWEPGFSTKQCPGGYSRGFGLASVRAFIEASGGNIEVYSTLGEGTIFTISLPVA